MKIIEDQNGNLVLPKEVIRDLLKMSTSDMNRRLITIFKEAIKEAIEIGISPDGIHLIKSLHGHKLEWNVDDICAIVEKLDIVVNEDTIGIDTNSVLIERPLRSDNFDLCISDNGINYRQWTATEIGIITNIINN